MDISPDPRRNIEQVNLHSCPVTPHCLSLLCNQYKYQMQTKTTSQKGCRPLAVVTDMLVHCKKESYSMRTPTILGNKCIFIKSSKDLNPISSAILQPMKSDDKIGLYQKPLHSQQLMECYNSKESQIGWEILPLQGTKKPMRVLRTLLF